MRSYFETLIETLTHDEIEAIHKAELRKNGFWGAAGAGCIFIARSTGRILLSHRSSRVEQPHTWGNFGGAIDPGENPEEAARREAEEETGHPMDERPIPLYVFEKDNFRYHNYLMIVDEEFRPVESWETQGHAWVDWGNWPEPLHFGLVSLFNDPHSAKIIKSYAEKFAS